MHTPFEHAYNFSCIEVKYKNVTMDLKAAVKVIKKEKGMFQFAILSFIGAIEMDRNINTLNHLVFFL